MFNIERWQEIFEAIGKNKLRTFLTGLSVGSGIFILVILLGIGNGMKNGVKKQFERDAATKVSIWSGQTSLEYKGLNPNRRIHIRKEDYQYAERKYFDDLENKSCNYRKWNAIASYKKENGSYRFIGAMPDMLALENAWLNIGRFVSEKDITEGAKVVCIGIQVANDLFKDYKKAVGKNIDINNIKFKVIGVYSDPGGEREDANLFIPHTTMTRIYNEPMKAGSMQFTVYPEETFEKTADKTDWFVSDFKKYLKKKHNIHPDDLKGIQSYSSLEEAKKFITLNQMIAIFFWGIGILTLIAGIVGVSNIMLIIVKERTKEIGIRKALGAQPKAIVGMILHEAIFITTISGFIGLFLSLALLQVLGPNIKSEFILNPSIDFNIAVTTVLLLIIAGALAGYIPARHASKIKPIIALRDE